MNDMETNTELYKKLLELQKAVRGLFPEKQGGTGDYKYVSGNKLLSVVRPKMDALGLLLKSEIVDIVNTRQDYKVGREQRDKSEVHTSLKMRFTWIDAESGQQEMCEWAANGQNDWDKGAGSAMTYGERYFLMKFFHIPTDEDDVDALREKNGSMPAGETHPSKKTFNPQVLEDPVSVNIVCKWLDKKEAESRDAGNTFSIARLLETQYAGITSGEINRVVELYREYKQKQTA